MTSSRFAVAGFDGHFEGNEGWIHLALPVLELDDGLWAVRSATWDAESKRGLLRIEQGEAEALVTRLPALLRVAVGERLLVVGPDYYRAVKRLELLQHLFGASVALIELPNGFRLAAVAPEEFVHRCDGLGTGAEAIYRKELETSHDRPTTRAQDAYHLLKNTGRVSASTFFPLDIVHARWNDDDARERRVVEVGEDLLALPPGELSAKADAIWRSHPAPTPHTTFAPSWQSPLPLRRGRTQAPQRPRPSFRPRPDPHAAPGSPP